MDLEILELWFKIMIDFNMPLEKYEDFIDKYSSFLWGAPVTYKGSSNQWSTVIFKQHKNLLYTCLLSFGITVKMTNLLSVISRVQSPTCTICCERH